MASRQVLNFTIDSKLPGKEFFPMTHKEATVLARQQIAIAKKAEKSITRSMKTAAKKNNGEMSGLKFRLKDKTSTTRKVITENRTHRWGPNAVKKEDLNDLNRYTMLFDEAGYTNGVRGAIADLEAQGFEFVKIKNNWDGKYYKRINCNLRGPDGRIFELQFHTERSLYVKHEISHPLYKKVRKLSKTENLKKQ